MIRVVEFRVYMLHPGTRGEFHGLVLRHSIPMLARWKADVEARSGARGRETPSWG